MNSVWLERSGNVLVPEVLFVGESTCFMASGVGSASGGNLIFDDDSGDSMVGKAPVAGVAICLS